MVIPSSQLSCKHEVVESGNVFEDEGMMGEVIAVLIFADSPDLHFSDAVLHHDALGGVVCDCVLSVVVSVRCVLVS